MPISDLAEVTSDTSSQDIAAYAEQVAAEVAAERKGEEKSDAQITSEHGDIQQPGQKPKETTAEKNSGSTTATEDGEDTGDESEGLEWLTDEVKAEAAAYGIDGSDLSDFASREELERVFKLFDKSALEAGRKALVKGDDKGAARNEKGQFVKTEETKTEPPKEESPKDGRYKVSLNPDIYDDEIIGEFTRMRDHYESRLEALEAHFTEASVIAKERQFDSFVDSLGHEDLFGKTDKETPEEKQRRGDLLAEVETYILGRQALGRPVEMNASLINRIARSLFSEELSKKELKQRTRKLSKQSDRRLGGSPTKPLPPRDDPRDEADRLYKEMAGNN